MRPNIMVIVMIFVMSIISGNGYGGYEGTSNTLFGSGTGNSLGDDDNEATFIGYRAGFNTSDGTGLQGRYNTFVGYMAGFLNITGQENTCLGWSAGTSNTVGSSNTFVGSGAGSLNTTGASNTLIGSNAGTFSTSGIKNTFAGTEAGALNDTGSENVFIGYQAGYSEKGSNKLYISNSNTSAPLIYGEFDNRKMKINGNLEVIGPDNGLVRLSNVTTDSTGKGARMVLNHYSNVEKPVYLFGAYSGPADNFVAFGGGNAIGNAATQIDLFTAENNVTAVGSPRITVKGNGYVGIGIQNPSYPLQMSGGAYSNGASWIDGSSREYKEEIEALSIQEALEAIKDLNPVKYAYKTDRTEKHVGFIAEDVPDLVATKDRKGLSPMDIVAVLAKVVQEQQKTIKEQKEIVLEQKDSFKELKAKNERLEQRLLALEAKRDSKLSIILEY